MSLTYGEYLKIDELLNLQVPQSEGPAHDEMLFIVIHQTYELWFKEILHEIDHLSRLLNAGEAGKLIHTLKRIGSVIKVLTHQLDVLETMTPAEFLAFRGDLDAASGFQSFQFRELEFALGYKREEVLSIFNNDSSEFKRLKRRLSEPSLWDSFVAFLGSLGYAMPEKHVANAPAESSPRIQRALREAYRKDPHICEVCESLLDIDERIQEWRYRHAKMVERVIGGHQGTGGSSGVEYLRSTLFKPFFPDLWAIRSDMDA